MRKRMLLAGVVLLTIGIILMFSFEPLFVKNVEVLNDCQDEYGSGDIVMASSIENFPRLLRVGTIRMLSALFHSHSKG